MRKNGFTLIELLIAMVLLAFISIFTGRSINNAIHSKEKIQHDLDKYSTVRDALKVIERDINDAFNYQDYNAQLFNLALKQRATQSQGQQGTPIGQPTPTPGLNGAAPPTTPGGAFQEHYKQKDEYKLSGFIGEKNSIDLTTLSNVRMAEDQQISMQAEVGYHLKNCRRRAQQNSSSNCLWRRVAPVIDDDLTKGGEETVLLENVEKFELRYLGPGKEKEWIEQWISTERGDALTKGKFPYAVEVTIQVHDKDSKKDKPLRMTIVAAVRNPNNPPPTTAQDPNNPNAVNPNALQQGLPGQPAAPNGGPTGQ